MKQKVKIINYLRGLSILAIILIHIIAWHDNAILTVYTKVFALFELRDLLEFFVVAIVVCSGFSLYFRYSKLPLTSKEVFQFYKKRFKRILIPWWVFLVILFSIHYVIRLVFGVELVELSRHYILSSFLMIGGIGFGWLIALMLILALAFPWLNYLYGKMSKLLLFGTISAAYIASLVLFEVEHIHIFDIAINLSNINSLIIFAVPFVLGWSIIYLIGFLLVDLYNKPEFRKNLLQLTFGSIIIFISVNMIYTLLNLEKHFYLNKYPPTPEFLAFGMMGTLLALLFFFNYENLMDKYTRKFLLFFSRNSFWLFMWNALTLSFFIPLLASFEFGSVYLRLAIAIILNVSGVSLLVLMQNKLVGAVYKK